MCSGPWATPCSSAMSPYMLLSSIQVGLSSGSNASSGYVQVGVTGVPCCASTPSARNVLAPGQVVGLAMVGHLVDELLGVVVGADGGRARVGLPVAVAGG